VFGDSGFAIRIDLGTIPAVEEKIKVDCHVHTSYSFDGFVSPARVAELMAERGMGAVCVTDHNSIEGALEMEALDPPFRVVVGEEIGTEDGELLGLFLRERIPEGRSVPWTIDAVKEQGGLIVVPHPFVRVVMTRLKASSLFANLDRIDLIEVSNGRNGSLAAEAEALRLARSASKPIVAGSDGHLPGAMGSAYVIMPPFEDAKSFLKSVTKGTLAVESRSPLLVSGVAYAAALTRSAFRWVTRPSGNGAGGVK
jgi:predicted metal-dependent phosphoesterase TrpH